MGQRKKEINLNLVCRIAAIVSENKASLQKIDALTKAMQHGGPDDNGCITNEKLGYSLGHNRLSIIDLSPSGHQPMVDVENNIEIIFNGEIYNYIELKNELQQVGYLFNSNSDTEVLIKGYHFWNTELFNKLRGMYAFILIDKTNEELIAVRDHAGIKPLYYCYKKEELIFSSEVKGFTAYDKNWNENESWKIWFLTYGFLPEPITTLKDVQPLERGNYLKYCFKTKQITKHCYYNYTYLDNKVAYKKAKLKTKELLEQSVNRHLVSDVPVGIFLSGGIDSSILAIIAQSQIKSPIETISIYFDDEKYSEKEYQELIIQKTNVKHHLYKITKDEFLKNWEDIFNSLDQPSSDAINTYFICKYAKLNGLKVVLSGLGADEIFGGYPSIHRSLKFNKYKRLAIINKFLPKFVYGDYPNKKFEYLNKQIDCSEYLLYRGLFTPNDVAKILNIPVKNVWNELSKFKYQESFTNLHPQNKATYFETAVYMQSQLLKDSDIQSMWQGIELRVPYLDRDLMDYINNLHPEIKFNSKTSKPKPLLVDAFIDELPNEIWNRPKQGFTFPFENWFRTFDIFKNNYFIDSSIYKKFLNNQYSYSRIWSIFFIKIDRSNCTITQLNSLKYKPNTLFTYLATFKETGGIQKVNKTILKSLPLQSNKAFEAWGIYDTFNDSKYIPMFAFKSFNGSKIKFFSNLIINAKQWNHIIVGHINIAPAIKFVKKLNPSIKLTLIVHGIDVWDKKEGNKKWLLQNVDQIISVSEFTKNELINVNNVNPNKIKVLYNCLDPYFEQSLNNNKNTSFNYLKNRYKIEPNQKVILTVSRIKSTEKYKGYDKVIEALAQIKASNNINFKYIICGSYDTLEYNRVTDLAKKLNIYNNLIIPGFVPDDELIDHYSFADLFIMPSKKEGFGIVFIEAAACGTAVIAGNSDGSREALQNGKFGHLIDPNSLEEIKDALLINLKKENTKNAELASEVINFYGFNAYKEKLNKILFS